MRSAVKFSVAADLEAAASAWIARRDAGMTAAEEAEFARWAADPRHAAALARHEQTWQIFDRPLRRGHGRVLANEFRARFARQRRRKFAATLGAISCLLMTGLAWRMVLAEKAESVPPQSAIVVLPEKRTLPDGTVVELKSGAEIAVDYSGQFRRVSLRRGAAHYQVAANSTRPFIVDAAGVAVRAVGTAFSVEIGQKAVAILVTEGQVAVASEDRIHQSEGSLGNRDHSNEAAGFWTPGDHPLPDFQPLAAGVLVNAGNHLVIELAPELATLPRMTLVSAPELAERLAWRAPRLEFTAAPLAEAIALMNRYNRVQFVIDDPALSTLEVSGYFRADNHETFLSLIEQGLGLESERSGERILLRKAL